MSETLPTPPLSVASSSEAERLNKRRRVISSSTESSVSSISSDLRRETFTQYRYRVGCPALAQLPLITLDETHEEILRFEQAEPSFRHILQRTGVKFSNIELVRRVIPEDALTSRGDRTVLIEANWTDDSCFHSWIRAADRIRRLLRNLPATRTTKVEIIAFQLNLPRGIKAVECGHRIVAAWPRLLPLIRYILSSRPNSLASSWLTIDLIRLGPIGDERPPLPIVVSILVDWACDPNHWDRARKDIDELLASEGFSDAHTEFEHGDVYAAAPFPLQLSLEYNQEDIIDSSYGRRIAMGDDVAAARYFESMPHGHPMKGPYGTFGGYLNIQKDGKHRLKMGLTNYHVIRCTIPGIVFDRNPENEDITLRTPEVGELLSKIDKNGFGPKHEVRQHTTLESPSRRKHNATIQRYRKLIRMRQANLESGYDPDPDATQAAILQLQKQMNELERFFDKGQNILGNVYMASGLARRSTDNHRLDWALVEVRKDRMGTNFIPALSKWPRSESVLFSMEHPHESVCGGALRGKASLKQKVAEARQGLFIDKEDHEVGGRLYKIGARTKLTHGDFSFVDHAIRWNRHDQRLRLGESLEYVFVQEVGANWPPQRKACPFSLQGDSGAFCIDYRGNWVGQISGGSTRQGVQEQVITYVAAQEDILKDIEELLNRSEKGWTVDLATD